MHITKPLFITFVYIVLFFNGHILKPINCWIGWRATKNKISSSHWSIFFIPASQLLLLYFCISMEWDQLPRSVKEWFLVHNFSEIYNLFFVFTSSLKMLWLRVCDWIFSNQYSCSFGNTKTTKKVLKGQSRSLIGRTHTALCNSTLHKNQMKTRSSQHKYR